MESIFECEALRTLMSTFPHGSSSDHGDVDSPCTCTYDIEWPPCDSPDCIVLIRYEAAETIQRAFRCRLARDAVYNRTLEIYEKHWDPTSGHFFYFNKLREDTTWFPPWGLRGRDMPEAEQPVEISADSAVRRIVRCWRSVKVRCF